MQTLKQAFLTPTPILEDGFNSTFRDTFHSHPVEKRINDARKANVKHPNKVPALVFKGSNHTPDISHHKYLLPMEMTMAEFLHVLRKYVKLESDQALFVFVEGQDGHMILPKASSTIQEIYREHKSEDNFLKFTYTMESTFG